VRTDAPDRPERTSATRALAAVAVFGVAYLAAEWIGLVFYFEPEGISAFWPASGVFLAALVLAPLPRWPALILVAIGASLTRESLGLGPESSLPPLAVLVNAFEAVLGASLIRRFVRVSEGSGTRPAHALAWALGIVLLSTAVAAALGAAVVVSGDPERSYWAAWEVWWFASALGVLAVAPAIVSWFDFWQRRSAVRREKRLVEGGLLLAGLVSSAWFVLGAEPGTTDSLIDFPYVVVPFLVWAALRFNPPFVTAACLLTALLTVAFADTGQGPFVVKERSASEHVQALQAFLVVGTVLVLVVLALALEQRRARAALRASEQKFRSLVETTPDWVWETDRNLVFTYSNPRVRELLGYEPEEMVGRSVRDTLTPETREQMEATLATRAERPEEIARRELVQIRKDGAEVVTETNAAPILDADGELAGYRGIDRDITERKRAEEEAERHRQELLEADKMIALGTLVSGVAHEINNPNHFIMLNLPILKQAWQDARPVLDRHAADNPDFRLANLPYTEVRDEVPEFIDEIIAGSDRIRTIVAELRNYSRREEPGESERVDVNEAVRAALTLLANPIKKATRNFSVCYGEDLPVTRGSIRRLEQVVINLVLNACQSLPDPDRAVRVSTRHDARRGCLVIEVADEGCGIVPEALAHIRDPFYTTKREQGGTGLGLAVSSRIVEEHRGCLEYESEVGAGTTARLSVPVYVEDEA
jgi:PAS domain S-box-containing protein